MLKIRGGKIPHLVPLRKPMHAAQQQLHRAFLSYFCRISSTLCTGDAKRISGIGHSTGSFCWITLKRLVISPRHWSRRKAIKFLLQTNYKLLFEKSGDPTRWFSGDDMYVVINQSTNQSIVLITIHSLYRANTHTQMIKIWTCSGANS